MSWIKVTKDNPCPVCHKPDWCTYTDDGKLCHCHRIPSPKPTSNGWIHMLTESRSDTPLVPVSPKPPTPEVVEETIDAGAYFNSLPTGNEQVRLSRYLARELGLCADILQCMDVRWDRKAKAVAFPMRDANEKVIGIRYRQLKTGKKWALKGSKDGLFFIPTMLAFADEEFVICEGPTDTIAAVACGLPAIGRSSCGTGAKLIKEMIRHYRIQRVTIASDADEPKTRPDGTTWRPGIEGAQRLAADIGVASRIVLPPMPHKDLRDWYAKGGMTGQDFNVAAASAKWNTPAKEATI